MEKPWGYHGEWSASGGPTAKTLGACDPSGFGLGTTLGTAITMKEGLPGESSPLTDDSPGPVSLQPGQGHVRVHAGGEGLVGRGASWL